VQATEQVLKFTFAARLDLPMGHPDRGRKLSHGQGANVAHITFNNPLTPIVGAPISSKLWDIEARQVSINPVTFEFPLPNLAKIVASPPSTQTTKSDLFSRDVRGNVGNGVETLRCAIELINDALKAVGPTYVPYIRPDGRTVAVKQVTEVDI
jgi:hypothetical protein